MTLFLLGKRIENASLCCRNTMVSNWRINSPGHDGLCPRALMRWAKHASRKISAVGHITITKTSARFGAELDAATAVFDRYHGAVKQCAFLKTRDPMLEW